MGEIDFSGWYESVHRSLQERRHLDEQDAQSQKHHDEMMKLIHEYKRVRKDYDELGDAYDSLRAEHSTLINIIKEHLPEMSITREEVNARLDAAHKSATPT